MNKSVIRWIKSAVGKVNMLYAFAIITSIIQAGLMVAFAVSIKDLVNSAITSSPELKNIIRCAIITISLAILAYLFIFLNKITTEKCRIKAEVNIKNRIFAQVLKKDFAKISAYRTGDILSRISVDSQTIARGYSTIIPTTVSMVTKVALAVGVLIVFQPIFTLFLILGGLIMVVMSFLFRKLFKKLYKATRQKESEVMSYINENTNNILAVKVFSAEDKVANQAKDVLDGYMQVAKKQRYVSSTLTSVMSFAFVMFYIATVVWGAIGLYNGVSGIDFGLITAMIQLVSQLQAPFANFTAVFSIYYEMVSSAERVIELENIETEKEAQKIDAWQKYQSINGIKCENLSFSYGREPVFVDASFAINKGDLVLIKGISGIGKSTLFKLMLGVYKDYDGQIYFDTNEENINLDSTLRGMFAFVPQGNLLFSGTIRENVCFLSENATQDEIEKAINIACMDFVYDLPNGLDTVIGENGYGLSEGQGQRVAIARAILANKPILLLDEATSALDEETEAQILKNVHKSLDGKVTCLFISHKQKASEICSLTLKITDGKITTERN